MAKTFNDGSKDAAFDNVSANANQLVLLRSAPGSYSNATTLTDNGGEKIGDVSVAGSDFSLADSADGRKMTLAKKSVSVAATGSDLLSAGTAHAGIVDTDNSTILVLTPASVSGGAQVDNGDTVDVGPLVVKVADP
jgi:hypothetical protein